MDDAATHSIAPPTAATAPRVRAVARGRLFRKYVALFVAVVSVALLANGAFEIWFSYRDHEASLIRLQREQAASAAAKIGQFVTEIQSQIGWTTELPWSGATLEQRRFDALRLLRQVPAITELAQLDATGHEQLRVSRLEMDVVGANTDLSHDPRFVEAMAHKVYYGPVYFRRESEPYMTLALAGTRKDAGVSVAEVNLKFIWDVVSQIKVGEHGLAFVVDGEGRLIAHPDISLVLRNTNLAQLAQVKAARSAGAGAPAEEITVARDVSGHRVLSAYALVEPLKWLVFVELPIDEAYAPLYGSIERAGALLVACLALAFGAGLFLAGRMVGPIQALRAGAARLGSGDLGQRIAIKTGDELESLADQFNDMAGRLQESYANLERKVDDRTRELSESLEQQTATAEVLRVISSSPGELGPVFETMLENATRICEADCGLVRVHSGGAYRTVGMCNIPPAFAEFMQREPAPPTGISGTMTETVHVVDLAAEEAYAKGDPLAVAGLNLGSIRSYIRVPLLKDREPVGYFVIYRQHTQPFTDKQIELVENFAAQAVIAIENVRLLTELREALEQQTATSEVLGVISSSSGELEPVFESLLDNALRICLASFGVLLMYDEEGFRPASTRGLGPSFVEVIRRFASRPSPLSAIGQIEATKRTVHFSDLLSTEAFIQRDPVMLASVDDGNRAILAVPMLKEDELLGAIVIYRREAQPFTDKQIELVENFAAQAVIAIENVRLLTELRESLERQIATSEVLRVISSSPGELEPVFNTMIENATRLSGAEVGTLALCDGDGFRGVAVHGHSQSYADTVSRMHRAPAGTGLGRLERTRQTVQVVDVSAEAAYDDVRRMNPDFRRVRTALYVPIIKEGELTGAFMIYRHEIRAFTDKQIELVENFAAQAVIAIENARLLTEIHARTDELAQSVDELKALGEVTQAVNSTLDLQTVLSTIVAKAVEISATDAGAIYAFEEERDEFQLRATYGMNEAMIAAIREQRIGLGIAMIGEAAVRREPVAIADLALTPHNPVTDIILKAGFHALLVMPLLRPDRIVGALVVRRRAPGAFSKATIDLLQTFAAQSVIAIQNARLFQEIDEKGRELAVASQHKSQFLANMSHELRTPLNAILGYTELILDDIYGAAPAKMREVLERVQTNGKHLLGLINDVLDLSKIEAGQLSLTLADYSIKELVQSVYVAVEPLASAKKLALKLDVAAGLPPARGDERRLSQVILNLVGNAIKFTDQGEVSISARAAGGTLTIAVRDTGPGIAESDQAKIFEEFQQADNSSTRQKGGTGLGLAISRRIVEMHGGRLWVESRLGLGSTFLFTLPVTVERQVVNA